MLGKKLVMGPSEPLVDLVVIPVIAEWIIII